MSVLIKFQPPYLRYDDPVDKNKIKAIKRKFLLQSRLSRALGTQVDLNARALSPETGSSGNSDSDVLSSQLTPKNRTEDLPSKGKWPIPQVKGSRLEILPEVGVLRSGNSKTAAAITVTPSGIVPLGFNCSKTFNASGPAGSVYWEIHTYSAQSGLTPHILLGITSSTTSSSDIEFVIDYSVYGLKPGDGFVIVATAQNGMVLQSDTIVLDFNAEPPCSVIHNVRFFNAASGQVLGATCDLKGGDHGSEPGFRVTLDINAKPGGQPIRIRSTNKNKAWLWGPGASKLEYADFLVPAGQQSFQDSGIFGTANVHSNMWTIQILSTIIFPDGTEGAPAYAEISLLK